MVVGNACTQNTRRTSHHKFTLELQMPWRRSIGRHDKSSAGSPTSPQRNVTGNAVSGNENASRYAPVLCTKAN